MHTKGNVRETKSLSVYIRRLHLLQDSFKAVMKADYDHSAADQLIV